MTNGARGPRFHVLAESETVKTRAVASSPAMLTLIRQFVPPDRGSDEDHYSFFKERLRGTLRVGADS